jgi:two-component system invasion response regulator UvrY
MVKVLLVDDHELVRSGIERLLMEKNEIQLIGVACTGEEAIFRVGILNPDVVLMDIYMPGIGGIEASRKICQKFDAVKILALSSASDGPLPQQILNSGIHGYVSKHCSVNELINAILTVHAGKRYVSQDVASEMAFSRLQGNDISSPFDTLSKRELQVVLLALQGRELGEIAEMLVLSPKTVSTYRHRVNSKLKVKNDIELMRLCLKYKLISEPN